MDIPIRLLYKLCGRLYSLCATRDTRQYATFPMSYAVTPTYSYVLCHMPVFYAAFCIYYILMDLLVYRCAIFYKCYATFCTCYAFCVTTLGKLIIFHFFKLLVIKLLFLEVLTLCPHPTSIPGLGHSSVLR